MLARYFITLNNNKMQEFIFNLIFGLVLLGTILAMIACAIDAVNATK